MKRINLSSVMLLSIFLLVSCGGPETVVINTIHTDGSVTRKVVMTHDKDEFEESSLRVPIDSTWTIDKTMNVSEEGDTAWVLTAEKHFESVEGINLTYESDSGSNKALSREVEFIRKFKWFNTEYRFSEIIRKAMIGYNPDEFFTEDELHYFYMPKKVLDDLFSGPDSLSVKEVHNRVDSIGEIWLIASYARSAYLHIMPAAEEITGTDYDDDLDLALAVELSVELFKDDGDEKDAVDLIFGEGFYDSNTEITDSLLAISEEEFDVSFSSEGYSVQTLMPGELLGTNGYIDKEGNIMWEVKGEFFLSMDYEMWAESKTTNYWAWVVSVNFVIFVIIGIIINRRKKSGRS